MNKYCFILNFGYAEDSHLGWVPFSSEKEFASAKDAFIDLSKFFLNSYMERHKEAKCCASARAKEINIYCSKCGNFISENELNEEDFLNFLVEISTSTVDSYAAHHSSEDDYPEWESSCDSIDSIGYVRFFVSEAERCIATAVNHNIYNDRNIDDLFDSLEGNNISFY